MHEIPTLFCYIKLFEVVRDFNVVTLKSLLTTSKDLGCFGFAWECLK